MILIGSLLALATTLVQVQPPSVPIATSRIVTAVDAFDKDPSWVQTRYGTPGSNVESTCCRFFGYRSGASSANKVLIQTYNLTGDAHLSFIYDRLPDQIPWIVVGIVYDAQRDGTQLPFSQIFPRTIRPRATKHITCWSVEQGMSIDSTSTMPLGRVLYVRYDTSAQSDTNPVIAPSLNAIAKLNVLQYGYFSLPIGSIIGLSVGNDDFSSPHPSCFHD